MTDSKIVNFFENKNIFLTGGTGFLGKVLVEKLLRVCQIHKIYVLIRPKKGKTVEERFEEYFDYPCFQNIKDQNMCLRDKIVLVSGDCEKPNLGLSKDMKEILVQNVNIVIHAAANVKFEQPLRVAANINVRSTVDILNLAKKMPGLKAFLYVSTAYSNCPHKTIEEKCYAPPITPKQLFSILDGICDDNVLNKITPNVLKQWPNAYTFTKSIAEYYLSSEGKNLPIVVIRPAMVMVTVQEPMPGWIDNLYGPIGVALAAALGVLRCINANSDYGAAMVPGDYVCNNILAALWNLDNETSQDVIFYNVCDSVHNAMTWGKYKKLIETYSWDYPTNKVVWRYSLTLTASPLWNHFRRFFLHTIFAYLADFILICIGRKPLAVNSYTRLHKLLDLTSYFGVREWNFITNNRDHLWAKMSPVDKKMFCFNMDDIDWDSFAVNLIKGGRVHLLKDPLETIPQSKFKLKLLGVVHYTLLALLYYLLYIFVKLIVNFFK